MTFASFRTTPWKGWLSCFCWFTRRVGRKWKERICDFESTAVAQLYCKLQFFSFLGANGVGCLGRYCRDFGEWFWLFKPGLVEFYPSSPCCCLNLDSFDWKFGNWWWYLFFFYVLVVFWIFGWGLCKMIDLREKHNSSQNKRSMVKPGVINSCVVEFGGQVFESIRQLIMFLGVYCPKAPDPSKNG